MRTLSVPCALHPCVPRSSQSFIPVHRLWLGRLTLALALALSGCFSSFQWVKEGVGSAMADAKFASCQLEAERFLYSSEESEEDRSARIHHESHLCMQADGWRWTDSDGTESSVPPPPRRAGMSLAQAPVTASPKTADQSSARAADDDDDEGEDEK